MAPNVQARGGLERPAVRPIRLSHSRCPHPREASHPAPDLHDRPGRPDPNRDVPAPSDSGIFRIDLAAGEQELVVPLDNIAETPYPCGDLSDMKHYFNVLLFSPDGSRLAFLHRWRNPKRRASGTRLFTAKPDGTDIRVVDDFGRTLHFICRDPMHILAWSWHPSHGSGYYVCDIDTRKAEIVGR